MQQSIDDGDPAKFDEAMRNYHDRVVAAGGVLIQPVLDMKDEGKQRLEEGLLATSGTCSVIASAPIRSCTRRWASLNYFD